MFRFGYLVSGRGRLLQASVRALQQLKLPFEIAAVVSNGDSDAFRFARSAGLPSTIVDAKKYSDRSAFDSEVLKILQDTAADGVMLNFNRLLGTTLTGAYSDRILNMHMSLLPLFSGFGAIAKSAGSGMRFSGATVHLVDESVDAGAIVAQAIVPMEPGISETVLGRRLFAAAVPLQLQSMAWLAQGRLLRNGAGQVDIRSASYAPGVFSPSLESPLDALPASILETGDA